MKIRVARLAILAALVALSAPLIAVAPPKIEFSYTRLQNGLRVIISEDHAAPVFSIAVSYDVGSRNERRGRTGFAHLFEHMMFKGSEQVGTGEHFVLVYNNGGDMNGTTNKDRTEYFERLPSNQLDLALFLEADRMRSLDITRQNLDNQRQAVQEERRLRVDNNPYGRTDEVLNELAYRNFAYAHSTIGSMDDLNAATIEDVKLLRETVGPKFGVKASGGIRDTKTALGMIEAGATRLGTSRSVAIVQGAVGSAPGSY